MGIVLKAAGISKPWQNRYQLMKTEVFPCGQKTGNKKA